MHDLHVWNLIEGTMAIAVHVLTTRDDRDKVLEKATSAQVLEFGDEGERVVCTVDEPSLVAELAALLAVVPQDPDSFTYCMCAGEPHLAFYEGDRPLVRVGVHHGFSIRWERWEGDAELLRGRKLAEWLAAQGAPGLLAEMDE